MPRLLASLVIAAAFTVAVASTVESGALDTTRGAGAAAAARAATDAADGDDAATGDGQGDGVPAATTLDGATATSDVPPRVVVPDRDLAVDAAPVPRTDTPRPEPRTLTGTGTLLAAAGETRDPVELGGRTVRFSVEVEQGTGLDPDGVAAQVEAALYDERSWARDFELRRVAPAAAEVHVVVGSPASTDRLCAEAGLDTNGWLSCWNGRVAAINLDRWQVGVGHVEDLRQYRRYVVNHEVGHGLGYGHVDCPGRGELAPLMQQQTKSLDGCRANEWAHPDGH